MLRQSRLRCQRRLRWPSMVANSLQCTTLYVSHLSLIHLTFLSLSLKTLSSFDFDFFVGVVGCTPLPLWFLCWRSHLWCSLSGSLLANRMQIVTFVFDLIVLAEGHAFATRSVVPSASVTRFSHPFSSLRLSFLDILFFFFGAFLFPFSSVLVVDNCATEFRRGLQKL